MLRVLVTALPSPSHEKKLLAVAEAFASQGCDVLFAGREARADAARERGVRFVEAGLDGFPSTSMNQPMGQLDRQAAALCTLASSSFRDLQSIVADFRPDLIVRDLSERGAFLVAELEKLPYIAVACTSVAPLSQPSSAFPRDARYWLNILRAEIGLGAISSREEESPFATLCFRPRSFFGEDRPLLRSAVLVRHENDRSRADEARALLAGAEGLTKPLVLAGVGTILPEENSEQVRAIVEGPVSFATVLALGSGVTTLPRRDRVLCIDDGPQEALIPLADAVVCHGGMNTTIETLSEGVPIVVVSSYEEAAYVGRRCEAIGVGKHVPMKDSADVVQSVRSAVDQVLHDESFKNAARRFADENAVLPSLSETVAGICATLRNKGALPVAG